MIDPCDLTEEEYEQYEEEISREDALCDEIYDERRLQELDKLEKSLDWKKEDDTSIEYDFKFNVISRTYHYTSGDYEKYETYDADGKLKCSSFGRKPIELKKENY